MVTCEKYSNVAHKHKLYVQYHVHIGPLEREKNPPTDSPPNGPVDLTSVVMPTAVALDSYYTDIDNTPAGADPEGGAQMESK